MPLVRFRSFFLAMLVLMGTLGGACRRIDEAPGKQEKFIINGQPDLTESAIGALTVRRSPFCTGTLITKQLVVTAAHCVEAIRQYGITNIEYRVDFPAAGGTFTSDFYQLDQAITHPQYSRNNTSNYSDYDIAVLILKVKASNVTPIAPNVDPMPQTMVGQDVHVVGYGQIQTQPNIVSADKKYAADIPVDQIGTRTFIHYDKATAVAQRKSACHGDSGGPALGMVNGKWVVLGVTSTAYRATATAQQGQTLCDGGAVSCRVDTSIADFLQPYLDQYSDGPKACTDDTQCSACDSCKNLFCERKPVTLPTQVCKPCHQDADCAGGKCLQLNEGYRCVMPCNTDNCCPNGSFCRDHANDGGAVAKLCFPIQNACPDATCTVDSDCGPSEVCDKGICKISLPPPADQTCRPCYSSDQCGTNGYCVGGNSGLGYCVQACSAGDYCPNGFSCKEVAAGVKRCMPSGVCSMNCSAQNACPQDYQCVAGFCKRSGGGKYGDFCNQQNPCAADYKCVPETEEAGRCALGCGPPDGTAASACRADGSCDAGLQCVRFGGGLSVCLASCSGTCPSGGQCTQLGRSFSACICEKDSDCGANQECNLTTTGQYGFGACVNKGTGTACPSNTVCRPASSVGGACLPEDGKQKTGQPCSQTLRCESGLSCNRFASEQESAVCMQSCSSAQPCNGNGTCINFGGGFALCLCRDQTECAQGSTCERLFTSQDGTVYGYCTRQKGSVCKADTDCPTEHKCENDICVFDPSKKNEPPPEPASPEVTPEPTAEKVTPEPVAEEPAAEPVAEEPALVDAGAEKAPEAAPQDGANTEVQINTGGGCSCNAQTNDPSSAPWWSLLLLAFFIRRRRR
ncbi:MAG: trypsin-like serine protease [Myxococcales bacterium]|nr:trypsin-like serine protease [Myxococcales bacterium]